MCKVSLAPPPLPHHHLQITDHAIPTLEVQTEGNNKSDLD